MTEDDDVGHGGEEIECKICQISSYPMGMRREGGGNGKNPRCRSTDPAEMRMRSLERSHIKICLMFEVQTLGSFGRGLRREWGLRGAGTWVFGVLLA